MDIDEDMKRVCYARRKNVNGRCASWQFCTGSSWLLENTFSIFFSLSFKITRSICTLKRRNRRRVLLLRKQRHRDRTPLANLDHLRAVMNDLLITVRDTSYAKVKFDCEPAISLGDRSGAYAQAVTFTFHHQNFLVDQRGEVYLRPTTLSTMTCGFTGSARQSWTRKIMRW